MNFHLRFYWSLLLRRLPVMTALFLICSVVGVVTAYKLPPTYSSSARLLVEEQQIPDSMVASTVRTDALQQLQVIEQQLLTRANMIDIARKFSVFEDISAMTPDAVVQQMRQQTHVLRTGGRGQATFMTLSFEARSGRIAADVVNEYVTLILKENNDFRISRVENTLSFFEQEVARLSNDLDLQSSRIVAFKNENATSLPDDLSYRQNRQALLQERLSRLERDRSQALNQRAEMVSIFEATGSLQLEQEPESRQLSSEEQRLLELQSQLEQALSVYSEANPRVVLLRQQISQAEASVLRLHEAREVNEAGEVAPRPTPTSMLDLTLAEIDQRVRDIDLEIAALVEQLAELEVSIKATSTNAITLGTLERDYQNIQQRYNNALNNLNQARMSERIEVSSQGQRISVIEGANVPQEPSGPSKLKIAAMGVAVGLGLACGFFALLEVLNRNIRRPAEMQARFEILPIATIPYMESARERFRRRAILVSAFVLVLIGVPTGLYYIDVNYMPLDVLANMVLNRFGII